MISCTSCHQPYPPDGVPYRCTMCGGLYDDDAVIHYDPARLEPDLPGIWRYRQTFGLPGSAPIQSLGEGNTPLSWGEAFGRSIGFKCEYLNPSGSFKDRGSATLLSFLLDRGINQVLEDSSGNAGASLAAYAARAGIRARIFIPDSASGPKRAQIEAYGAELVRIMGSRSNAAKATRRALEQAQSESLETGGIVAAYASHAYLPFNLPGYATLAYELYEEIGTSPGTIVLPVGQGGLLLGLLRGFDALHCAGVIADIPRLVGVQARACAPLWALHTYGPAGLGWVAEAQTLAEGIRVRQPLRGDRLLQALSAHGGLLLAVDEEEILPGRAELAHRGYYVEPTSAVVWGAVAQLSLDTPEPIVAILTGSGLKYLPD